MGIGVRSDDGGHIGDDGGRGIDGGTRRKGSELLNNKRDVA